jgi:hypothetical protein
MLCILHIKKYNFNHIAFEIKSNMIIIQYSNLKIINLSNAKLNDLLKILEKYLITFEP